MLPGATGYEVPGNKERHRLPMHKLADTTHPNRGRRMVANTAESLGIPEEAREEVRRMMR